MSIWTPAPETIRSFYDNGFGNMGDVDDVSSPARFTMREVELDDGSQHEVAQFVLVGFRMHFTGGAGLATMTLRLDHRDESKLYDWTLRKWGNAGVDAGGKAEIVHTAHDEADLWGLYPFWAGDELVFTWPDPSAGVTRWAFEVFFAYVRLGTMIVPTIVGG